MEPKSLGLEELILLRITFILLEGPVSLLLNFNYVPPPKVRLGGGGGGGVTYWFLVGGGGILVSVQIPLESASVSALASVLQILVPMISLEPVDGIQPNLPGYIIGTSLRSD